MNELDSLLILNNVNGLGQTRLKQLIEKFGCAKDVLRLKEQDLVLVGVTPRIAKRIAQATEDSFLSDEYKLTTKHNVKIVTYKDEEYPKRLRSIPTAPIILYVKGQKATLDNLSLAIVGSRRASMYGLSMSERFACGLSELGITIVSGLARGIDTVAHRAALRVQGETVAVLGCGLSHIYPPENRELLEQVTQAGCVISEFPMTMPPLAQNFPRRNRIISGLSLGVIVVEASKKSGALITSDFALEQGREVFAVPGQVDHPNSFGVHTLIKQGAKLIHSVEDVLEELQPQLRGHLNRDTSTKQTESQENPMLLDIEQQVYDQIHEVPVHIDQVARRCNQPISWMMSALLQLELKGLIKQQPGKLFIR